MATGGCDQLECLLRKVGIADSEFTAKGRVHVYQGKFLTGAVAGQGDGVIFDAYQFWANKSALMGHDIVMNSCECGPWDRTAPAYAAMHDYVNAGGRLFGTHFHYNWFAAPTGPSDFQSTAAWLSANTSPQWPPFYLNTTFPKGQAFSDWIQEIEKGSPPPPGQIVLDFAAQDVGQVLGATTPWIYYGDPKLGNAKYSTAYLSFNAPVGQPPSAQCGRAVFSDLHVSANGGGGMTFPQECTDPSAPMTEQEAALEFLFFDLSSCVQDDQKPPPPPPPN
jgi:hypothetical protein